jgi:DNA-binding NarL/FixJ family response regulator
VLIAEDHVLMADAIASWVNRTCEVIGRVHKLAMLRPAVTTMVPDVVLLDLAFSDESALLALPELVAAAPQTKFVILTAYGEASLMQSAMDAGAWGFVVKSSEFDEIVHAITEVMAGRMYQSAGVKTIQKAEAPSRRPLPPGPEGFQPSPRQVAILKLIRSGITLRAAGTRMGFHHKTIEYHLKAVQTQLGLEKREELMRWVDEHLGQ